MTRGTTPTFRLICDDFDTLENHNLYVTIEQGCTEKTFSGDKLEVEGNVINLTLTQEDTLDFRQGTAKLQLRGVDETGNAYASKCVVVSVNPVLQEGVIV